MSNKTINSRIQLKHDTEANWAKATNFIPLKGEVIVYDIDDTHTSPRVKIGDGTNKVFNLPFIQGNNGLVVENDGTIKLGDYAELSIEDFNDYKYYVLKSDTGTGPYTDSAYFQLGYLSAISIPMGLDSQSQSVNFQSGSIIQPKFILKTDNSKFICIWEDDDLEKLIAKKSNDTANSVFGLLVNALDRIAALEAEVSLLKDGFGYPSDSGYDSIQGE